MSKHTTHSPLMSWSFKDRDSAERAYDAIASRGYKDAEIHVLMTDETRKRLFQQEDDKDTKSDNALKGAGVGGAVGGIVGAAAVGFAAAASSLVVPGLGLVIAGPLAGALAGGAAGATAGGLTGMLVGAGLPEDKAKLYEKQLKDGEVVIAVKPVNEDDARYFETEWQKLYGR